MADRVQTSEVNSADIMIVVQKSLFSLIKVSKISESSSLFKLTKEVVEWGQLTAEWGSEQTNAVQSV